MKRGLSLLLAAALGGVCLAGAAREDGTVREEETIAKRLQVSDEATRLVVENVDGFVHVRAGAANEVKVQAHKMIRAESDSDLQQAKREVKLAIREQPGTVSVEYEAPGVCRNGRGDCHNPGRRFYQVSYDIDVTVPRTTRAFVSTVNHGDVQVSGTAGEFECRNVNGAIVLKDVTGSGSARTVNGPVKAYFAGSPRGATSFATVNGPIDTYFPGDLAAELRCKTFHGAIYSDFDVTPVAVAQEAGERDGAAFVYHSNGMQGARVGRGGPEIAFDTLNGDIRLHKAGAAAAKGSLDND